MPPARDTKTRFQGVYARHQEACRVSAGADPAACNCTPSYYGVVWDRSARKTRKTRRFKRVMEARNARKDLADALNRGTQLAVAGPRLADACDQFIEAAREGVALNKWGRRYRRRAWEDLESALRHVPDELLRRRLGDVSRGDVQRLVDELTRRGMSGSRVRSVVNALRSLYRWAQDRELVGHDPAANVRLPAMDATPRDRVATPDRVRNVARDSARARPRAVADGLYAGLRPARKRRRSASLAGRRPQASGAIDVELAADVRRGEIKPKASSWRRVVPLVKRSVSIYARCGSRRARPAGKCDRCGPRRQESRARRRAVDSGPMSEWGAAEPGADRAARGAPHVRRA